MTPPLNAAQRAHVDEALDARSLRRGGGLLERARAWSGWLEDARGDAAQHTTHTPVTTPTLILTHCMNCHKDGRYRGEIIATRCTACDTHHLGTFTTCPRCGSHAVTVANITLAPD